MQAVKLDTDLMTQAVNQDKLPGLPKEVHDSQIPTGQVAKKGLCRSTYVIHGCIDGDDGNSSPVQLVGLVKPSEMNFTHTVAREGKLRGSTIAETA
jgi:hypothetical protein